MCWFISSMDILLFSRFATCLLTCWPQPAIFSSFTFEIINLRGCLRKQLVFHNSTTGFSMKWYICGMAAEIPYQWHITSRIWVVLWIGWKFASSNQKHYWDLVIDVSLRTSTEFLGSFLRRHFAGRPVVAFSGFLSGGKI